MNKPASEALLLVGPNCPHCTNMMNMLGDLLKQGHLGKLEIINVTQHAKRVAELDVRTVPWLRIGDFELEGSYSRAEIIHWINKSGQLHGRADYFEDLLARSQLAKVVNLIGKHPEYRHELLYLVSDPERRMDIRIGVGAVFEELQSLGLLHDFVDALATLSHSPSASVRCDVAHYLSLTQNTRAIAALQKLLQDPSEEVREIAAESLAALQEAP